MAEPVYGFNEADAHNLVRLIRNDRADLTETPFLPVSYTNIYIATLTTGFSITQLQPGWSAKIAFANLFDLKFTPMDNSDSLAIIIDPLSIFSDDLSSGARLYCVPYEQNYFLALQAPCGS
jgi:hypothetical protein